ncbi:MAG: hypothetical protein R2769_17235 [Saprospiraceae bacterium]
MISENTRVCGNVAQPVVEILNAGSANLTSLDIYYSINNGPERAVFMDRQSCLLGQSNGFIA